MEHNTPTTSSSSQPVSGQSPANNGPKPTADDRLSELPDLPILHILSHLQFQHAVRTSLLSKRFNSLWNSVPELTFSDQHSGKSGDLFVKLVDTALGFHDRREIDRFSVEFKYDDKYGKIVDNWIDFAVRKLVKSLHLNFVQNRATFVDHEYELPRFLFENENLVELVTSCCKLEENWGFRCNKLKFLSLKGTKLSEGLISRVLDGCSVLETLELRDWSGFDRLKIGSSSLRVLRIVGEQRPIYVVNAEECLLEISGPNLVSLEVSGSLYRSRVQLSDLGSLIRATMDFKIRVNQLGMYGSKSCWFDVRSQDIVREVLESLCLVNVLTIGGGWFIKVLSTCEACNLSSPWSERKSLILCIPASGWDHLGIASLLHSSPFLDKLVIKFSYCSDQSSVRGSGSFFNKVDEEYYWTSWSTISKCPLLHLKTVKVVDFRASSGIVKPLFRFLQFLLVNSKVLEEIVIQTSSYVTKEALVAALELPLFPSASPDAVVHFEPLHFWVDPFHLCQMPTPL